MGAYLPVGEDTFVVGDWLVEPALDRISSKTRSIHLRPQLTELLVYLASLNGRVASLESIHDNLWPGRVVSSGTIYNCVAELRCQLEQDSPTAAYIETLPKRGYRLAVPACRYPRPEAARPVSGSVVVFPVEYSARRPSDDALPGLLANELVLSLAQVAGLRVHLARTGYRKVRHRQLVGRRYGASYTLVGSLSEHDRGYKASFYLEDTGNGYIAWSRRLEWNNEDFLESIHEFVVILSGILKPKRDSFRKQFKTCR